MGDLAAFQAAISLLHETKQDNIIDDVYDRCLAMVDKPISEQYNAVKDIYRPFTAEQISKRIAELLTPPGIQAEVRLVYQSIEGLHAACPDHTGDWYFTGDYPTPGGNRVVNRAFVNWRQGKKERAY
jgi:amidophosphoribosyltransferase